MTRTSLRVGIGAAGGVFVLLAVLVDGLHAGMLASFGRAQWLLVLLGGAMIFAAVTWRRAGDRFRDGAAMVVAGVLLLIVAELLAGPASRFLARARPVDSHGASVRRQDLSFVASTDWAAAFWPEHRLAEADLRYQPYVLWGTAPFDGALTTITPEGYRRTPDAQCGPEAYRVFVFGGSTVWGWGVPDWGTIPAYLQAGWNAGGGQVCVVNMGQNGFVSTQEVIALLRVLQHGEVPDLVISYHGFNDVHAAFETGRPGVHYAPERIAAKLEEKPDAAPLLPQVLDRSALVDLLGGIGAPVPADTGSPSRSAGVPLEELHPAVLRAYLVNVGLVGLLASEYGFEYLAAWQPSIYSDAGGLNPEEQEMFDRGMAVGFVPLLETVRADVAARAATDPRLVDLSGVFDTVAAPVWQDFVHPVPAGNRVIAAGILEALAAGPYGAPEAQAP